jgi:hypothetical protein
LVEPDEYEKELITARKMRDADRSPSLNVNSLNLEGNDYHNLLKAQEQKFNNLQVENQRLKHFLPDSYTEMRLREK